MIYKSIDINIPGTDFCGRLTTYFHQASPEMQNPKRPVIVVCPGGAYQMTSDREAEPIALKFLAMGYHAAVLRYSVAPARYPVALSQLACAVAILRQNAEEWNIDANRIIVQGFSAGGHLVASLGVFWNRPFLAQQVGATPEQIRPNGLILGYPVITSGPLGHQMSFEKLLGQDYEKELAGQSLEKQVSEDTPPTFLWHTANDELVPVENSLLFFNALHAKGISAEMHIFPNGPHGLALATEETAGVDGQWVKPSCASWINLADQWIKHTICHK